MELRASYQIKTVIKALTDIVLPAVDANNKLAQEQTRLAIGVLQLMAQGLPLQYRYDRTELAQFVDLARALTQQAGAIPEATMALRALGVSLASGADVLERARAEPTELEAANLDLRDKIGALITAASSTADAAKLKAMNASVLTHAKSQLLRERAWVAGQGWEPAGLPKVETLLD